MTFRRAIAALAVGTAVMTACGGGGNSNSQSSSASSASSKSSAPVGADPAAAEFCRQLSSMAQQLSSKLGGAKGPTTKADFNGIADVYAQLEKVAPPAVKPTITDLVSGLREAAQALTDPAKPDVAKLQDFQKRLAADSAKLSTYNAANCKA